MEMITIARRVCQLLPCSPMHPNKVKISVGPRGCLIRLLFPNDILFFVFSHGIFNSRTTGFKDCCYINDAYFNPVADYN
uniref:Uncharacterized protein n=1 Tax=Rhizophora mucronata TaxID=61149 RepID=A0A2P2JLF6_RHIMU